MFLDLAFTAIILTHLHGLDRPRHFAERSAFALRELSPLSLPYLDWHARYGPPGGAARSADCLTSLVQQHPEWFAARMRPAAWPTIPWIDMLPDDFPERAATERHFRNEAGELGCNPDWPGYRLATRNLIARMLADGCGRERAQRLLNDMRDVEIRWIIERGSQFNPPVPLPNQGQGVGPVR